MFDAFIASYAKEARGCTRLSVVLVEYEPSAFIFLHATTEVPRRLVFFFKTLHRFTEAGIKIHETNIKVPQKRGILHPGSGSLAYKLHWCLPG